MDINSIDSQIKELKKTNENNKLEKARAEVRLEELNNKRDDLLKRITEKGIQPEDLPEEVDKSKDRVNELLNKIKALLGKDEDETSAPSAPF